MTAPGDIAVTGRPLLPAQPPGPLQRRNPAEEQRGRRWQRRWGQSHPQEFGVAGRWAHTHAPPLPTSLGSALPGGGECAAVAPVALAACSAFAPSPLGSCRAAGGGTPLRGDTSVGGHLCGGAALRGDGCTHRTLTSGTIPARCGWQRGAGVATGASPWLTRAWGHSSAGGPAGSLGRRAGRSPSLSGPSPSPSKSFGGTWLGPLPGPLVRLTSAQKETREFQKPNQPREPP